MFRKCLTAIFGATAIDSYDTGFFEKSVYYR